MSIGRMDSQQSFYHTSFVCNDLFGATDRYRLFREKILPQLMKLRPQLRRFTARATDSLEVRELEWQQIRIVSPKIAAQLFKLFLRVDSLNYWHRCLL